MRNPSMAMRDTERHDLRPWPFPTGIDPGTRPIWEFVPRGLFTSDRKHTLKSVRHHGVGATIAESRKLKRLSERRHAARVRVAKTLIASGIRPGDPRSACKTSQAAAQHGCGKGQKAFFNTGWNLWCCGTVR